MHGNYGGVEWSASTQPATVSKASSARMTMGQKVKLRKLHEGSALGDVSDVSGGGGGGGGHSFVQLQQLAGSAGSKIW